MGQEELAELRGLRAEVAAYRAETNAQRAEYINITDRLGRALDSLELDVAAVIKRIYGEANG